MYYIIIIKHHSKSYIMHSQTYSYKCSTILKLHKTIYLNYRTK